MNLNVGTAIEPHATEMRGLALLRSKILSWFTRNISRKIPRLVWIGDEIDVRVVFTQDPLNQADPLRGLFSGGLFEIEKQLHRMGVGFDTGQGCGGRDWEWDWSLSGPISVVFRGRARNPELRTLKLTKPKLSLVS